MKEFEMKLYGLKELERLMEEHLPASASRRVMLKSLHKSAEPSVALAKAYVPKDSGALGISIGTKSWNIGRSYKGENPWKGAFAGISMGPMSGTGKDALAAWAVYMAHHKRKVELKRGKPIGRIRHGHLVRYPARRFLEMAATVGGPQFVEQFKRDARARVIKAIKYHNSKSPARAR